MPSPRGYSPRMQPPGARRLREIEPFLAMEVLERAPGGCMRGE